GCVGSFTVCTLLSDLADDVVIPFGSTASACFNDTCVTGTAESTSMIMPRGITFPSESGWPAEICPPGTTGRDRVEFTWHFPPNTRLQTGDRYSAMLIDASGAIIAVKEGTATSYSTFNTCSAPCHWAQSPQ